MQQIEDTILGKDIYKILNNTNSGLTYVKNAMTLHTKELDIPIRLVESVEIMRDYNNNIADYVLATFIMEMGDYIKDVHPYRDNLMLTINTNANGRKNKLTYKFVISNNTSGVDGSMYTGSTRDELNKFQQVRVVGQCIDVVTEILRLQYVSGIYNGHTVTDVIRSSMLTALSKVKINGAAPSVYFNIYKAHNTRAYNHIKIPTGTMVLDIPTYLQKTDYGVYNGDVGTYIQRYEHSNDINSVGVFVYPLYNREMFDKTEKKLIIYAVNSIKFELAEHTYLVEGDLVKMIAGGSTKSVNTSEDDYLNHGVGINNINSDAVLNRGSVVTPNGVTTDTNTLNNTNVAKNRNDQANKIKHVGVNANMYNERSGILKSNMMLYQVTWNFCNPDLIYPGMPVLYNYMDVDNGLIKLKGSVQSFYIMYNEGTKTTNGILNIMVEKPYINPELTMGPDSLYLKKLKGL